MSSEMNTETVDIISMAVDKYVSTRNFEVRACEARRRGPCAPHQPCTRC